jgi:hypothetical protein
MNTQAAEFQSTTLNWLSLTLPIPPPLFALMIFLSDEKEKRKKKIDMAHKMFL